MSSGEKNIFSLYTFSEFSFFHPPPIHHTFFNTSFFLTSPTSLIRTIFIAEEKNEEMDEIKENNERRNKKWKIEKC
jgi:hypothetical protein